MDATESEEFDFHSFNAAVSSCRSIGKQVRDGASAESSKLLADLAAAVQQRTLELGKAFRSRGDANRTGCLSFPGVVRPLVLPC
jgi:hypothetical protein